MYSQEMFEKFMIEAIRNGIEGYLYWEKCMKEIDRKLVKKKEWKTMIKELETEYETKRG